MNVVFLPVLLASVLLTLLVAFWLLWPLRGRQIDLGLPARQLSARVYRDRLDELNADLMAQRIDAESYAALKLELDRSVLADTQASTEAAEAQPTRSLRLFAISVILLLPLVSLGVYWGHFLNPLVIDDLNNQRVMALTLDRVLSGNPPPPEAEKHSLHDFMRALQRRVQSDPNNADAWMTLGVGFLQAKDMDPAKVALSRAAELRPDDTQIVLTYVQATIVTQQGAIDPQARTILTRILHDQPDHQGALLMLALGSLRAGDHDSAREAVLHLQRLRVGAVADAEVDTQLARLLAEANGAPAGASATNPSGIQYDVEVTLAPALVKKIPADATVFIFARSLQGPPMPVAVIRRPASQFPIRVTLSDSDSLMPDRLLSQQNPLVVQARISRTGNASPSVGDWEAVAVPVEKGNRSLIRLRVSETR